MDTFVFMCIVHFEVEHLYELVGQFIQVTSFLQEYDIQN